MSRIIAGQYRGQRLSVPTRHTRPTTDYVREALFNVLEARLSLKEMIVIDLYAGSGALGLEALSRGAHSVLFVDSSTSAIKTIKKNIHTLKLPHTQTHIYHGDVFSALLHHFPLQANLIFADPPYALNDHDIDRLIKTVMDNHWISPEGIFVCERSACCAPITWPPPWRQWFQRCYGGTRIDIGCYEPTD